MYFETIEGSIKIKNALLESLSIFGGVQKVNKDHFSSFTVFMAAYLPFLIFWVRNCSSKYL